MSPLLILTVAFSFIVAALVTQLLAAVQREPVVETVLPTLTSGFTAAAASGLVYLIGGGP